jgi:hypothetical protein
MDIFAKIAERKIQEAIDNGEFDNLPNQGRPLNIDEDPFIPQDLRMAYRILKNAGCIPPELELRNEIISLRKMIDLIDDDRERIRKIRELNFKIVKLNELRRRPLNLENLPEYEEKLLRKFVP